MTQVQLATELKVCQQAVAKWESGRADPKWELAPCLARVLNCKIDELFVPSQRCNIKELIQDAAESGSNEKLHEN